MSQLSSGVQFLTEDDVIAFYAVARPHQTVFGEDAYPTISLKAAALMQSLAENQPFVDGNRRIAWICGKVFLQFHGLNMHATTEQGFALFAERIANGMTVADLADSIDRHTSAYLFLAPI